jgi:hypothetical protein
LIRLAFTYTSSAAGFHHHISKEMLLWKAEVQYGCRNAARQSHGQQIRGSRRHPKLSPAVIIGGKRLNISSPLIVL